MLSCPFDVFDRIAADLTLLTVAVVLQVALLVLRYLSDRRERGHQ
jgi:hypothetical protein